MAKYKIIWDNLSASELQIRWNYDYKLGLDALL